MSALLKARNLLIFREAQNAGNDEIAANWNVSGTRDFSFAIGNSAYRVSNPRKVQSHNSPCLIGNGC
jgi:hypothetical protein